MILLLASKSCKPGFSSTWTVNLQMFKLVLEKAEESEVKLPTSAGSSKKQESSRETSISALLTMPKPLTVCITISCGRWNLQEMGIPDHLICVLRNLYAGQEATVRTGHGTTDWFQIGKGYPLQYSGLENSMDCIVRAVTKSRTRLSEFNFHRSLQIILK